MGIVEDFAAPGVAIAQGLERQRERDRQREARSARGVESFFDAVGKGASIESASNAFLNDTRPERRPAFVEMAKEMLKKQKEEQRQKSVSGNLGDLASVANVEASQPGALPAGVQGPQPAPVFPNAADALAEARANPETKRDLGLQRDIQSLRAATDAREAELQSRGDIEKLIDRISAQTPGGIPQEVKSAFLVKALEKKLTGNSSELERIFKAGDFSPERKQELREQRANHLATGGKDEGLLVQLPDGTTVSMGGSGDLARAKAVTGLEDRLVSIDLGLQGIQGLRSRINARPDNPGVGFTAAIDSAIQRGVGIAGDLDRRYGIDLSGTIANSFNDFESRIGTGSIDPEVESFILNSFDDDIAGLEYEENMLTWALLDARRRGTRAPALAEFKQLKSIINLKGWKSARQIDAVLKRLEKELTIRQKNLRGQVRRHGVVPVGAAPLFGIPDPTDVLGTLSAGSPEGAVEFDPATGRFSDDP